MNAICKADYDKRTAAYDDAVKAINMAKEKRMPTGGIILPEVGYHDIYGLWFFGELKGIIRQIGTERFGVELGNKMHVYVDVEPVKIATGIHDITVYDHRCRLYKWLAQGYHRGLVVLVDDLSGNNDAAVYMESVTWSWVLPNSKARLLDNTGKGRGALWES